MFVIRAAQEPGDRRPETELHGHDQQVRARRRACAAVREDVALDPTSSIGHPQLAVEPLDVLAHVAAAAEYLHSAVGHLQPAISSRRASPSGAFPRVQINLIGKSASMISETAIGHEARTGPSSIESQRACPVSPDYSHDGDTSNANNAVLADSVASSPRVVHHQWAPGTIRHMLADDGALGRAPLREPIRWRASKPRSKRGQSAMLHKHETLLKRMADRVSTSKCGLLAAAAMRERRGAVTTGWVDLGGTSEVSAASSRTSCCFTASG